MAKVKGAQLVLEITDDGTLKVVEQKAKKAGKGMKNMAENAHTADRRIKGAAQASSGASKNFSKMAQGIQGGLVPAYATFAATMFAVGAAFRAFQNAADFQALQASQEAYANSTGVMLKQVTADLAAATQGQLDLQKAGASAAIMIAKGFNTDQINDVAEASVAAAQALGRNFEDTFNRIVQGTTKAEPELLDELGITLRLETATRRYANAIGKRRDELTTFERSQAVLNETLRQAAENFGAIQGQVPVNAFNKLQTTVTDLTMSFQTFIAPIANFFANVFSTNITAAVAAIGLFAVSIIKQVIPSQAEMVAGLQEFSSKHDQAYKDATADLEAYNIAQKKLRQTEAQAAANAKRTGTTTAKGMVAGGAQSPILKRAAKGIGDLSGTDKANLNKALKSAEAQYRKHGKIVRGIFKGMEIDKVRMLDQSTKQMAAKNMTFTQKMNMQYDMMKLKFKKTVTSMQVTWGKGMAAMGRAGIKFGNVMSKVMGAAGVIGIVLMVVQILMSALKNLDNIILSIMSGIGKFVDFILGMFKGLVMKLADILRFIKGETPALDALIVSLDNFSAEDRMTKFGNSLVGPGSAIGDFLQGSRDADIRADKLEDKLTSMAEKTATLAEMEEKRNEIAKRRVRIAEKELAVLLEKKANGEDVNEGDILGLQRDRDLGGFSSLEEAEFRGNVLSTSGITGALRSLRAAQESGDFSSTELARMQNGVQNLMNGLVDVIPEMAQFKDVTKADADAVDKFVQTNIKAGMGLKTLTQISEEAERRRAEATKSIGNTFFDKELAGIKSLVTVMDEVNKKGAQLSDDEAATVAKLMGMTKEQVLSMGLTEVISHVQGIQTMVQGEIDSVQTRAMAQLGTSLATARVGSRKDAAAVRMKELIKIQEFKNKEADVQAKINELNYNHNLLDEDKKVANQKLIDQEEMRLKIAKAQTEEFEKSTTTAFKLQQTFATGLQKMFEDIATGAASAKDAFKSLATLILQELVKIAAQKAAMATINAMGFGFANGGIIPLAMGGYTKGYRSGGVVSQPTFLVGEGRYNEAVVPLPDGRSIPVEMHGGGSNVVVNVNVNGQGSAQVSGNGGANMEAMGKAIAALVQKEMVEQQRPGGVLSPYNGTGV
jgi:hypothetical protein